MVIFQVKSPLILDASWVGGDTFGGGGGELAGLPQSVIVIYECLFRLSDADFGGARPRQTWGLTSVINHFSTRKGPWSSFDWWWTWWWSRVPFVMSHFSKLVYSVGVLQYEENVGLERWSTRKNTPVLVWYTTRTRKSVDYVQKITSLKNMFRLFGLVMRRANLMSITWADHG